MLVAPMPMWSDKHGGGGERRTATQHAHGVAKSCPNASIHVSRDIGSPEAALLKAALLKLFARQA